MKPKVIVICGPTASGKTSLSIEVAKKIDGEIISCDSMQIYKDMNSKANSRRNARNTSLYARLCATKWTI